MASRLYFPDTLASPITTAPNGTDWGHNSSVVRRLLTRYPDASALNTEAVTYDAADHIVNTNALLRQYCSNPLLAQTISGNVKLQLQALEANAGNDLFTALKIYLVNGDGSSVGATLLSITRDATEFATSLTNRAFANTAMTSQSASLGDRLVIEIGAGGTGTASGGVQGHNFSLRWGCVASSGDLPEDDTTTTNTFRGWIEFANNLLFLEDVVPVAYSPRRIPMTQWGRK